MAPYPLTQPKTDAAPLRILLVEDSDIDRDLVRRLLTVIWPHRNEAQIEFAREGYEALDRVHANPYSLILLDWRLPGMDGGRLLAALKHEGYRIPAVVLTGLEQEELKTNLDKYGAVYLHKDDLNLTTLHQSIATALSNILRSDSPSFPVPVETIN